MHSVFLVYSDIFILKKCFLYLKYEKFDGQVKLIKM